MRVIYTYVAVCTDLSDKEAHIQVGMGRIVTSGNLGGQIDSTLVWNARDVGPIHALGAIFPIFITPVTLVDMTKILYKLCDVWLLHLHVVCTYVWSLPVCM